MAASEEACREYMDNTPLAQRSPRLELEAIANAVRKTVRAFRSKEFDKLLAVADPANGVDFVKEVSLFIMSLIFVICFGIYIVAFIFKYCFHYFQVNGHWSSNPKPEMTLEKLQKIATTPVDGKYKVRWLKWWNSSPMTRDALRFLPPNFIDNDLDLWLVKASFWAQVML